MVGEVKKVGKSRNFHPKVGKSRNFSVFKVGKIALCGLRWFKLNVSKYQTMSSCQKDVKCQKMKHLHYGGGSQKN